MKRRQHRPPGEGEAPAEPRPNAFRGVFPPRKHPAHGVFVNPDRSTIVFLTVCTKNREPWLANSDVHERLRQIWAEARAWAVGRYVIMPDHLHFFAGPADGCATLDNWVRYWKSLYRKRDPNPAHRWQADHWDTRLRAGDNYGSKWQYVRENPLRHGLVTRSDDWPYQGEMNALPW